MAPSLDGGICASDLQLLNLWQHASGAWHFRPSEVSLRFTEAEESPGQVLKGTEVRVPVSSCGVFLFESSSSPHRSAGCLELFWRLSIRGITLALAVSFALGRMQPRQQIFKPPIPLASVAFGLSRIDRLALESRASPFAALTMTIALKSNGPLIAAVQRSRELGKVII